MANYTVKLSSAPKGHEIPSLLRDVGAFVGKQKHGTLGWFDAFAAEAIPKEWNEEKAAKLRASGFAFMHLPEGSLVALLKGGDEAPPAVALLGSEGEARTVANSLEEFLALWSKGQTDIGELDDEDGRAGRKALSAWLKDKKVKPPKVKKDFDFESWLHADSTQKAAKPGKSSEKPAAKATKAASTKRETTPAMKELGPKLRQLAQVMGQRADAPEVVAYVTKVLGKKVPQSTSDRNDSANVEAPKVGVELVFSHDVLNDDYPPIPKTGKTFVPYLTHAWVHEKLGEPVLGVPWDASADDIEKKLGKPTRMGKMFVTDKKATIPEWTRDLGGGVTLEVSFRKHLRVELSLASAGYLEQFTDVSTALFIGWAATRGLLDEARFAAHADLLAAVKKRAAKGSDLMKAALPRGLWDAHLKDAPGLREAAYLWFHNMGGSWITGDLKKVFGKREGKHGHDEPKLDDDTWAAVDKAAKVFESRFSRWLE